MNKQFTLKATVMVVVTIMIGIGLTPILQLQQQAANAVSNLDNSPVSGNKTPLPHHIPIATSGNNIYIVWWDNKTGNNDEVIFKASTDGGKTFGDKINLSNSTKSDSQDAQIDTFGDNDSNVIVTWWERNATSNEPVARISTDNGKTFGQIMKLSANGTIGSSGG